MTKRRQRACRPCDRAPIFCTHAMADTVDTVEGNTEASKGLTLKLAGV